MFGDYIVYVDESGDHSLASIDPNYPMFVLAACIIRKDEYENTVNALLKLKFDTFEEWEAKQPQQKPGRQPRTAGMEG